MPTPSSLAHAVNGQQPSTEGGGDGFGSTRGAHPREERSQMSLNLALADSEAAGYFINSLPVRQ